ncbi:MAG: carboxypeptidase-like regulatory domain-containing protein [Flavobacteriaceae bacterium]|nr:carboxypeptidase-like regulatory domain-containing protein [Flavobacteriaceae bacterium]
MKSNFICGLIIVLGSIHWGYGQDKSLQLFKAKVEDDATGLAMQSVHVVNLNEISGTTTNIHGEFELMTKAQDTLYFSYIGYKPLKVAITNDMIRFGDAVFKMTELAFALEEVILQPYRLTGYLDIDVRNSPTSDVQRYSIAGLPNLGYESGGSSLRNIARSFRSIFDPLDLMYNTFSRKSNEMRKLNKMREDESIRDLLAIKFDRQVLMQFLNLEPGEIDEVLGNCNYSEVFIKEANDLQILEAISKCYEEYRILSM